MENSSFQLSLKLLQLKLHLHSQLGRGWMEDKIFQMFLAKQLGQSAFFL